MDDKPQKRDSYSDRHVRELHGLSTHSIKDLQEERTQQRYSRRTRQENISRPSNNREKRGMQETAQNAAFHAPYAWFLLTSFLLSLTFYSFPLFGRLATGVTSVNLYSGFAMDHGQVPYNDFYGSSGPLFYFINRIGSISGNTWLLWFFELFLLFLTGIFSFRLASEVTSDEKRSLVLSLIAMFATAGLSLGGDSAAEFATPFLIYGIYRLNCYFKSSDAKRDEGFILYGMAGAIASSLLPIAALLWLFGFFAFLINNIRRRLFGRALYQFLAGIFGGLVIYVLLGYYTLTAQVFFPAIEQSVIFPLTHFSFAQSSWFKFLLGLILLLIFGLFVSFSSAFKAATIGKKRAWALLLLVNSILTFLYFSFSSMSTLSDVVLFLPYMLIFIGEGLNKNKKSFPIILQFIRKNFALPLIGLIFLITYPFMFQIFHGDAFTNERTAANYVKSQVKPSDSILVAADDDNISLLAKKVSSLYLVPSYYPESDRKSFDVAVSQTKAAVIIVKNDQSLPSSLNTVIKNNYSVVKTDADQFTIYKKNG